MGRHLPRFRDLEDADLDVDLHVHTSRTDGKHGIAEMLRAASERGIRCLAFTEHVRRDTTWFPEFAAEVRAEASAFPDLHVLVGCEAKALDDAGALDAPDAVLAEAELVLGSVHRIPDGSGGQRPFVEIPPAELARIECDLGIGLLNSAPIDALAHPGGMYQRRYGPFPDALMRRILETALERDLAVEISSSYLRDFGGFIALCKELNPRVLIGSDAHRTDDVGLCRDRLRQAFRAAA